MLEEIKAEIERIKKGIGEYPPRTEYERGYDKGGKDYCEQIIGILDTLKEQPVELEKGIDDKEMFNRLMLFIDTCWGDFFRLDERDDMKEWLSNHFYGSSEKSEIPTNLDEAVRRYATEDAGLNPDGTEKFQVIQEEVDAFKAGAEWQRDAMLRIANEHLETCDKNTASYKDAFFAGADWQREQMMKETVEHFVVGEIASSKGLPVVVHFGDDLVIGQKVKLIIIKED